ncbi:MAG: TrmB family transcriptional regulator [Candidatus Aenigmarchaeota archaeon]|nr:TrmB family transcriptional regulator [Candidatus Aenigmarchaeota archaeon]
MIVGDVKMTKVVASQKVLDVLKTLGLNSYERKLYVTLLAKGTSTAGSLSELSGVPRSRTYDVLESLADKGFVVIQSNKPLKYVAIPPDEALERLRKKHEEDFKELTQRIEEVKKSKVLDELKSLYKKGVKTVNPAELTGAIRGRYAMHQQLESVLKRAKDHIYLLTSEEGLIELYENQNKLLRDAAKRGVDVRIAAPITKTNEGIIKDLSSYAKLRNTKGIKGLRGRFAIVDGKEVIVALTDEKTHPTQDLHLWSQSSHIAGDTLRPLFEMVWENAEKYN